MFKYLKPKENTFKIDYKESNFKKDFKYNLDKNEFYEILDIRQVSEDWFSIMIRIPEHQDGVVMGIDPNKYYLYTLADIRKFKLKKLLNYER